MKKNLELSPLEKVAAALKLLRAEGRAKEISISGVCKIAKVNRSSLYVSHPELIAEIKRARPNPPSGVKSQSRSESEIRAKLKQLEGQYKALLRIALEQQAEIEALRKRAQSVRGGGPRGSSSNSRPAKAR